MTTRGQWFAQGACLLCGRLFAFDPERVCSHPWPPPDGPLAPICGPASPRWSTPNGAAAGCPSTRSCPAPTSISQPKPGAAAAPGRSQHPKEA